MELREFLKARPWRGRNYRSTALHQQLLAVQTTEPDGVPHQLISNANAFEIPPARFAKTKLRRVVLFAVTQELAAHVTAKCYATTADRKLFHLRHQECLIFIVRATLFLEKDAASLHPHVPFW
jgi:hypothetical protein